MNPRWPTPTGLEPAPLGQARAPPHRIVSWLVSGFYLDLVPRGLQGHGFA